MIFFLNMNNLNCSKRLQRKLLNLKCEIKVKLKLFSEHKLRQDCFKWNLSKNL